MLTELTNILSKRRVELAELLENHSGEIEIEKQHQIYGAINEIDVFLQTLQYYQSEELKKPNNELKLVGPANNGSVFTKIFGNLTKVFRNK